MQFDQSAVLTEKYKSNKYIHQYRKIEDKPQKQNNSVTVKS